MTSQKPPSTELSDVVNDTSLIGTIVEVNEVNITEFTRSEGGFSHWGVVSKESHELPFKGEYELGIDHSFIHARDYGFPTSLQGEVCQEKGIVYLDIHGINVDGHLSMRYVR